MSHKISCFFIVILTFILTSCVSEEVKKDHKGIIGQMEEDICFYLNPLEHVEEFIGYTSEEEIKKRIIEHKDQIAMLRFDLRPLERLMERYGLDEHSITIGDLASTYLSCTAFQVTDRLFLTAGHCFEFGSAFDLPKVKGKPLSKEATAQMMNLYFNYQINENGDDPNLENAIAIDSIYFKSFSKENKLDVALFSIKKSVPLKSKERIGHMIKDKIEEGDQVLIIQHPFSEKWDLKRLKMIDFGEISQITDHQIFHTVATEGGSSGSPIIHVPTGKIIGVHTDGECVNGQYNNRGLRIDYLLQSHPELLSFLFSTKKEK